MGWRHIFRKMSWPTPVKFIKWLLINAILATKLAPGNLRHPVKLFKLAEVKQYPHVLIAIKQVRMALRACHNGLSREGIDIDCLKNLVSADWNGKYEIKISRFN